MFVPKESVVSPLKVVVDAWELIEDCTVLIWPDVNAAAPTLPLDTVAPWRVGYAKGNDADPDAIAAVLV
jgi:hypothetical protein